MLPVASVNRAMTISLELVVARELARRAKIAAFDGWRRLRHSRRMVERRWLGWLHYHGHLLVALLLFWRKLAKQECDKLTMMGHRRRACIRACVDSRSAMLTMMSHGRRAIIRACNEPPATIHDEPQATIHRRERLWATDDDPHA